MAEGMINDNAGTSAPATGQADTATGTVIPDTSTATQTETADTAESAESAESTPSWGSEYQTPEEMYAELKKTKESYKNLQSVWTKDHGKLLNQQKAATAPQQQRTNELDPVTQAVEQRLAPIQDKLLLFEMQNSLSSLKESNPDTYDKVAPQLQDILNENPSLWGLENPLAIAYEIGEGRLFKKDLPDIIKNSKAQADKVVASKQAVSGDGAQRQSSPPTSKQGTDDPADRIVRAGRRGTSMFG